MRIHEVTKLTDERWLNLFAATFENRGHVGRWVFASRKAVPHRDDGGDAVVLVPILKNPGEPPRLVVIREFRIPAGGYMFGLPAGLIDPGETAEGTARREMVEETGLEVTAVRRITPTLLSTAGLTDEAVVMAFLDVRGTVCPTLEESEDIDVVLLDFDALCRLCDDTTQRFDAKLWLVMWMYRQLGRLE